MAKQKTGRTARRRPAKDNEQPSLPGAETPRNEAVHSAALFLLDKIHALTDAKADEDQARQSLIEVMTTERVLAYHHDKIHIVLKGKQTVHIHEDKEKKPRKKKEAA